ncbi:hypothetical protein [Amycolatopsis sp. PS_44_ISF1]|uniref:hypothetical protein n=1 Tax=Amycolatopsis sp. PS_44_ISF1 TaxID=2974917 RepID=UPI0037C0A64B
MIAFRRRTWTCSESIDVPAEGGVRAVPVIGRLRRTGPGPDVAVLYIRLPEGNGIELARQRCCRLPALRCLMLTSYTDEQARFDSVPAADLRTGHR